MLDLTTFNRLNNNNLPTFVIKDCIRKELSIDTPLWPAPYINIIYKLFNEILYKIL